jgi:hypothetical protein
MRIAPISFRKTRAFEDLAIHPALRNLSGRNLEHVLAGFMPSRPMFLVQATAYGARITLFSSKVVAMPL